MAFGRADGLRSTTFAGGQQPAGSIGPDGRLWLPSYRGVVVVDPARIPPAMPPPGVRAEEILVDGVARREREALEVGSGRHNVEIRYAPTTLQPPDLIQFRYRLEGFDTSWAEVGSRRAAYFAGLPPGSYELRACGRIADGPWGGECRLVSLVIRPAFHQSWWFRALAAALVLAGAVLAFRIRTFQLRRRHSELERLVVARTGELALRSALLEAQSKAAQDGILAVDPDGRVLLQNGRFAELFPDREEEPEAPRTGAGAGVPARVLLSLEDPETFCRRVESLRSQPAGESNDEASLKDGRILDCHTRPLKGDDGTFLGWVWYFRDVTQRRSAEEELRSLHAELVQRVRERTAELTEANRELEAYSYSISHELRTPLRAIDGYSALVARRYEGALDREGLRLFGQIRWNAQRMGQLIDDFLDFSRAGRVDLAFRAVDMTQSAKEAFSRVAAPASLSRISLVVDDLPEANGDAVLLGQVWENLLSNAVKFSAMRERPEIRIEGSVMGDESVYRVRDNGVGFDMRYVDKLFGVFHRLQGHNEFEGTGVGLALVRRIVTRHGGRVFAKGELDRGATFSFSLPSRIAG